jgi:hypothetical protein
MASILLQLICAKISKETPQNRIHVCVSTGEHLTCNDSGRTALSLEVYSHGVTVIYPNFVTLVEQICGPGSSVGIATDYGLDASGSNLGGDGIIPPVQTGPGAHPASC